MSETTRFDEPRRPAPAAAAPRPFFGPLVWTTLWTALAAVLLGAAAVPWLLSDPARISRFIARVAPGLQADSRRPFCSTRPSGAVARCGSRERTRRSRPSRS